jgi:hypothetical protein
MTLPTVLTASSERSPSALMPATVTFGSSVSASCGHRWYRSACVAGYEAADYDLVVSEALYRQVCQCLVGAAGSALEAASALAECFGYVSNHVLPAARTVLLSSSLRSRLLDVVGECCDRHALLVHRLLESLQEVFEAQATRYRRATSSVGIRFMLGWSIPGIARADLECILL